MLTRRTFLTTIAAAPLAGFCKTEPARPYVFKRNVISIEEAERRFGLKPGTLRYRGYDSTAAMAYRYELSSPMEHLVPTAPLANCFALPQGTLG